MGFGGPSKKEQQQQQQQEQQLQQEQLAEKNKARRLQMSMLQRAFGSDSGAISGPSQKLG